MLTRLKFKVKQASKLDSMFSKYNLLKQAYFLKICAYID